MFQKSGKEKIGIDTLEWYVADKRGIVVGTKEDIPKSKCDGSKVILESSIFKLFESKCSGDPNKIFL